MTTLNERITHTGWERIRTGNRWGPWKHVVSGVSYLATFQLVLDRPAANRDVMVLPVGQVPMGRRVS